MPAIRNHKLEKFAQELALGRTPSEASATAGYAENASSFGPNARKRAQDKRVKARVAELRAPGIEAAERDAEINTEYVLNRAARIANFDLPASRTKVSDQVAALNLIAKVIGSMAPEEVKNTGKIVIEWAKPE